MRPVIQSSCTGRNTTSGKGLYSGRILTGAMFFIVAHSRGMKQKNGLQIAEEKKALGIYYFVFSQGE